MIRKRGQGIIPGKGFATPQSVAEESGRVPSRLWAILAIAMLLAAIFTACSTSPVDQQAIRDAWSARDAERAAECRRKNVGYAAGGCVASGP